MTLDLPVRNVNRTVGTMLGSQVTKRFGADGLVSWGNLVDSRTTADFAMSLLGAAALIVLTGRFAIGITRARLAAQRHVQIQAWQLRQLLPRARTIPSDAVSTHI